MKTRTIIACMLLALLPLRLAAQEEIEFVKGGCTPDLPVQGTESSNLESASRRRLAAPQTTWDASKTYKQLVILFTFSDLDFQEEHTRDFYDQILNKPGFESDIAGNGCIADYFKEQSNGLFNVQFDVVGPYQVSQKAQPYSAPDANTKNNATGAMREATKKMMEANPNWNFAQYDWNKDGEVDQVIYIAAGYAGNQGQTKTVSSYGYIWPGTGTFNSIDTHDNVKICNYTSSAELWLNNTSCGIGTICHEYSHCLGLPDIYPTNAAISQEIYSICDEWDLMDGGNFTGYGWCPPNYTAQEKMYLGWLAPTELTEPTSITGMKPVSEGGEIYIIYHTDNEYYLLENRQWTGWDAGLPGCGLLITHVDFSSKRWRENNVNNVKGHFSYDIVHADNLDYEQWNAIQSRTSRQWTDPDKRLHNRHLSTSPYPWKDEQNSIVNRELTDTSTPAAVMFNDNIEGLKLMGKAITNIQQADDGTISFDFMMESVDVKDVLTTEPNIVGWYDLNGQPLNAQPIQPGVYITAYSDGTKKKTLLK